MRETSTAMATRNNFVGHSFLAPAANNGANWFGNQRFNRSTGVVASFREQVPEFLRNDPDVMGMVAALNREETNFNKLKMEVEMRGKNK